MALPQPPMPHDDHVLPPPRPRGRAALHALRPAGLHRVPRAGAGRQPLRRVRQGRPGPTSHPGPLLERPPADARHLRLIAINIGVFVWLALQDPAALTAAVTGRDRPKGQFDLGLPTASSSRGEWYRLVTSGFLHFGIIHLAFNMLLLFQLGQLLEPAIGRIRFALLYFAALLGGSAGALLLQPNAPRRRVGRRVRLMGAAFVGLRNRGVNPFSTGIGTSSDHQPADHVHDPGHLDRRSHRRHPRRRRRRLGRARPRLQADAPLGDLRRPGRRDRRLSRLLVSVIVVKTWTRTANVQRRRRTSRRTGWRGRAAAAAGTTRRAPSRRRAGRPRRRRRT